MWILLIILIKHIDVESSFNKPTLGKIKQWYKVTDCIYDLQILDFNQSLVPKNFIYSFQILDVRNEWVSSEQTFQINL